VLDGSKDRAEVMFAEEKNNVYWCLIGKSKYYVLLDFQNAERIYYVWRSKYYLTGMIRAHRLRMFAYTSDLRGCGEEWGCGEYFSPPISSTGNKLRRNQIAGM
jgi:hypothetical protein